MSGIQAQYSYDSNIMVVGSGNNVTISDNVSIGAGGAGILTDYGSDGIDFYGSSSVPATGVTISNNTLNGNLNNGIEAWGLSGTTISGNTFDGNGGGIELWGYFTNGTIKNNSINNNTLGGTSNLSPNAGRGIWGPPNTLNPSPPATGHNGNNTIENNIIANSYDQGINIGQGIGWSLYNNTIYGILYNSGYIDNSIALGITGSGTAANLTNNIIGGSDGMGSTAYIGASNGDVTLTGSNNLFYSFPGNSMLLFFNGTNYTSNFSGFKTAISQSGSINANPLFVNSGASNFQLGSLSPAIDSGTSAGITADYAGNSIYGTPDLGGYEYQPPYTVGTNNIPTTGSARIYTNGKYRMTTASSTSVTAGLTVTPPGGSYQATTTQYMDITINTWNTSGNYSKQWTTTSTTGNFLTHATSTVYTITDLHPTSQYTLIMDGVATTTAITDSAQCTSSVCIADGSGQIQFTYTGGYSTHTFGIQDLTPPTLTEVIAVSATTIDNTPSYTFSSSESGTVLYAGSCSSSTTAITASTNTTVTFNTLTDGTYTNCKISVIDAAGNDSATTTLSSFIVDTTNPSVSLALPSGAITNSKPMFSWSGSDATSGISSYSLYVDNSLVISGNSTSYTPTLALSCGNHTWYVYATDNAGNTTNTSLQTFSVSCGGGGIFFGPSSSLPGHVVPRPQIITPDGKVTYLDELASTTVSKIITPGSAQDQSTKTKIIIFTHTLKKGSHGFDVTALQELLKKDSALYPGGLVTGYFGSATERAIQRFQKKYGIVSSGTAETTGYGVVGPKTRGRMNKMAVE